MSLNSGQKLKKFITAFLICGAFLFVVSPNNALAARAISNYQKLPNGTLTANEWNSLMFDTVNDPELLIPGRGDFVNTWATTTMIGPLGIGTNNPLSTLDIPAGSFYVQNAAVGSLGITGQNSVVMADPEGNLSATSSSSFFVSNNILSLWSGAKNGNIWNGDVGVGNVGIGTTNPAALLQVGATDLNGYVPTSNTVLYGPLAGDTIETSNILELARAYHPGIAYGRYAALALGTYTEGSNYNARLDIKLSNTTRALDVTVMSLLGNGNVGIGTTSPQSTLDIPTGSFFVQNAAIGSLGITNQTSIVMSDREGNLVATSSASFFSDNNILSLWGGSLGGNIWNANSGNVGIGTTNPGAVLEVNGTSAGNGLRVTRPNTSGQYIAINEYDGSAHRIQAVGDKPFRISNTSTASGFEFYVNNAATQAFNILPSGRVGIGDVAPDTRLSINSSSSEYNSANSKIAVYSDASSVYGIGFGNYTSYGLGLFSGQGLTAAPAVFINSTGNVGIGTTGPAQKLELNNGNISLKRLNGVSDSVLIGTSGTAGTMTVGTDGMAAIEFQSIAEGSNSSQQINFITHETGVATGRRMTIDKKGNVGIGTTSPQSTLDVPAGDFFVQSAAIDNLGITNQDSIVMSDREGNLSAVSSSTFFGGNNILSLWGGAKNNNIWNGDAGAGNVGIGTTTPNSKLNVYGTSGDVFTVSGPSGNTLVMNNSGNATLSINDSRYAGTGKISLISEPGGNKSSVLSSGRLILGSDNSEAMRIVSGNVGIGTTAPAYKMEVSGTFKVSTSSTSIILDASGNVLIGI